MHYFDPSLLIHDGSAFQTYIANDRKMIKESYEITSALVSELIKEQPDIILIPGDLTKDGEKSSHVKLAALLDSLQMNGKTRGFCCSGQS